MFPLHLKFSLLSRLTRIHFGDFDGCVTCESCRIEQFDEILQYVNFFNLEAINGFIYCDPMGTSHISKSV
jgi:hypothetical protein